MHNKSIMARIAGAAVVLGLAAGPASADLDRVDVKAVGTWSNLSPFQQFEKPFWEKTLPEASDGKVTGQINSIVELGLKGWEVMRLLKLGVFDAAFGVYGYVASENPALEGVDLSAIAKDYAEGRQIVAAYAPVLERHFNQTFNAKYLLTYPYPSQLIFCNAPVNDLSDLQGKKVRVYSTTLGDFVEGAGGTSVTIAFAEVVPALQKGVADCGITGTMPAYQAKWHEVITHAMEIRVGMGLAFLAMSNRKWDQLNAETQTFLLEQSAKLEHQMWAYSEAEDEEALTCLSGSGPCPKGDPGKVQIIQPDAGDLKDRERILRESVLKRWAARCSEQCVAEWNETVAPIVGVKAEK